MKNLFGQIAPPPRLLFTSVIVFLILFSNSIIFGQNNDCIEPNFPFDGIPKTPLCEEIGDMQFDLYVGEGTTTTHSSQIGNPLPTHEIRVVGNFTIDNNFLLNNSTVMIDPDVSIIIEEDAHLIIDNSSLFACDQLWNGISMNDFSSITTRNNTIIEDAKAAIQSSDKVYTFLKIDDTRFNRNRIGLSLLNPNMLPHGPSVITFNSNSFECDAPLNGTDLEVTFAGIELENTQLYVKGNKDRENTFIGLQNGINAIGISSLKISYFEFENILNTGIVNEKTNLNASFCKFTQGKNRDIEANLISDLVVQDSEFSFVDNTISGGGGTLGRVSIYGENFRINSNVDIKNNHFLHEELNSTRNSLCIFFKAGIVETGTRVNLFDNYFTYHQRQGDCIKIEGDYLNANSLRIEFNKFLDCGDSQNLIHVNDGGKQNLAIVNNIIDGNNNSVNPAISPNNGINLEGSIGFNNEVSSNRYLVDLTTFLDNANATIAIRTTNFFNTTYCDNSFADVPVGLSFNGVNLGTLMRSNEFIGGSRMLRLNGIIGDQGNQGANHNGNTWRRLFSGASPIAHAECISENCDLSRILVHTEQVTSRLGTTPEYYPAFVSPQSDWFTVDLTGIPIDFCANQFTGGEKPELLFTKTANGELDEETGVVWEAEKYLYKQLIESPETIGESNATNIFVGLHQDSNIESFYEISNRYQAAFDNPALVDELKELKINKQLIGDQIDLVESEIESIGVTENLQMQKEDLLSRDFEIDGLISEIIATYNTHLADGLLVAFNLNNKITTSALHEINEKAVNRILISSIINRSDDLAGQDLNLLLSIAMQCPQTGGIAVYKARGMLPTCERIDLEDDFNSCYPEEIIEERTSEEPIKNASRTQEFTLFPNPASDYFEFNKIKEAEGELKIIDALGREYLSRKFSMNDWHLKFQLDMPKGIYFCSVYWDDGTSYMQSLFIQ